MEKRQANPMAGGRLCLFAIVLSTIALGGCHHTIYSCHHGMNPSWEMPYLIEGTAPPLLPPHVIQPGDVLEIEFPFKPLVVDATEPRLQSPPEQSLPITVREDGMIALPLIGSVQAAGLTPEQLQDELINLYKEIQYDPHLGQTGSKSYLVMVNDTLDIRFRNQPDLDQTLIVGPDGKISLFLVGSVAVEGLTTEQIDDFLTERYSEHIPNPDINVNLADFSSNRVYIDGKPTQLGPRDVEEIVVEVRDYVRKIYVMGEVNAAQTVQYKGSMTAAQAVAAAGGHKRTAQLSHVTILRKQGPNAEPVAIVVDLSNTLRGLPGTDLSLMHEDVLIVPKNLITKTTDVLEQYVYQVVPFTRNSPVISFFYDLSRQAVPQAALSGQ